MHQKWFNNPEQGKAKQLDNKLLLTLTKDEILFRDNESSREQIVYFTDEDKSLWCIPKAYYHNSKKIKEKEIKKIAKI